MRVNLTDGGEKGLKCTTYESAFEPAWSSEVCPWDKIPKDELIVGKPPIKTRTKTFEDLEKLALDGLNYHWGRNKNHAIAKDVKINEEAYEVYVNGMNTEINHINSMVLIYNTNNDWGRSGNPGVLARTFYNVGYLEFSDGWGYDTEEKEEKDFKLTAAHELGHTILESYGGVTYSWQHKGSSYLFPQDEKPVKGNEAFIDFFKKDNMKEYFGEYYPREGEWIY